MAFDYTKIPVGYYDHVAREGSSVRRCWPLLKFQRVRACLPRREGQSILDVGCFAGTFLSMLDAKQFSRQVGVDILATQVAYANRVHGTPYRRFIHLPEASSLASLTPLTERFDCVTLIEVIEHLTRPQLAEIIDAIACLMEPGGTLVISTPNYASSWPVLELLLSRVSDVS